MEDLIMWIIVLRWTVAINRAWLDERVGFWHYASACYFCMQSCIPTTLTHAAYRCAGSANGIKAAFQKCLSILGSDHVIDMTLFERVRLHLTATGQFYNTDIYFMLSYNLLFVTPTHRPCHHFELSNFNTLKHDVNTWEYAVKLLSTTWSYLEQYGMPLPNGRHTAPWVRFPQEDAAPLRVLVGNESTSPIIGAYKSRAWIQEKFPEEYKALKTREAAQEP